MDVGGPFKIETKPYNIATKVVLASADDKPSAPTPVAKPAAAEATPETPTKPEPEPMTTQAEEIPATRSKGPNWIILSALIGLGIAAAGITLYKKTVV